MCCRKSVTLIIVGALNQTVGRRPNRPLPRGCIKAARVVSLAVKKDAAYPRSLPPRWEAVIYDDMRWVNLTEMKTGRRLEIIAGNDKCIARFLRKRF